MEMKTVKQTQNRLQRSVRVSPRPSLGRLWKAIVDRNRAMDGLFVYAVRSTGIYCRPSCPARRPGRDHVVFFDSPTAAESSGYRACLRCRPNELALESDTALL